MSDLSSAIRSPEVERSEAQGQQTASIETSHLLRGIIFSADSQSVRRQLDELRQNLAQEAHAHSLSTPIPETTSEPVETTQSQLVQPVESTRQDTNAQKPSTQPAVQHRGGLFSIFGEKDPVKIAQRRKQQQEALTQAA